MTADDVDRPQGPAATRFTRTRDVAEEPHHAPIAIDALQVCNHATQFVRQSALPTHAPNSSPSRSLATKNIRHSGSLVQHLLHSNDPSTSYCCLLYTSDAADDLLCVDLGGRRIIKKKK